MILKKIIVNGKFLTQRVTGVQRYAREILLELDKIIEKDQIILAVPCVTKKIPNYKNICVVSVGKGRGIFWEQVEFPLYVKKQKGVSLNLCNAAPLLSPGIVCIHDVKIKAHPEYFSAQFRLWYELLFLNETKRARKIVTVSDFSKKEIMKYYGVKENKIVVIPNAWQHYEKVQYDENTLIKYKLQEGKYYFAMGSMEPNKNFKWIAETAKKMPNDLFAIAGSINEKVFSDKLGFEKPPNMMLLGYVTDEEAKTLMRDCKAFLFPSIYEGFGIPPLEAMSAGAKRIVASDIPVMHEIFGNAVSYIKPNGSIHFQNSFESALILERYSWSNSAKKLYKMLC